MSNGSTSKGLKLTDVLVTVVVAIVFAVIYRLWTEVYNLMKLTGFQAEQLSYGMWFIAATVAFLIIRKPGIALLAEAAAASGELIMGAPYGLETFIYGIIQGLCAELIFAAFRYKKYSAAVAGVAGMASALGATVVDMAKGYMLDLESWNLILYLVFRFTGSFIICGWFAFALVKALEKTGVTQLVRPASADDYQALERKRTL